LRAALRQGREGLPLLPAVQRQAGFSTVLLPPGYRNREVHEMAKSMEAKFRARIATIARKERGQTACSRKTAGKKGYFTSCDRGVAGGKPEFWCSDFARWVWWKAGAINTAPGTDILTAAAGTFVKYGKLRTRPRVGDAVLFGYNKDPHNPTALHVGIVVQVNANTIVSVSGDIGGQDGSEAHFSATSRVTLDNAYSRAIDSSDPNAPNHPLSGFVSPVEDDMPYTKKQITKMVQEGVDAELNTKLAGTNITPAQGMKAAFDAQETLKNLTMQVNELKDLVSRALPPVPPAEAGGTPGASTTPGAGSTTGTSTTPGTTTTPGTGNTTGTSTTSGTGNTTGTGTTSGTTRKPRAGSTTSASSSSGTAATAGTTTRSRARSRTPSSS
jgi:CHAP domain